MWKASDFDSWSDNYEEKKEQQEREESFRKKFHGIKEWVEPETVCFLVLEYDCTWLDLCKYQYAVDLEKTKKEKTGYELDIKQKLLSWMLSDLANLVLEYEFAHLSAIDKTIYISDQEMKQQFKKIKTSKQLVSFINAQREQKQIQASDKQLLEWSIGSTGNIFRKAKPNSFLWESRSKWLGRLQQLKIETQERERKIQSQHFIYQSIFQFEFDCDWHLTSIPVLSLGFKKHEQKKTKNPNLDQIRLPRDWRTTHRLFSWFLFSIDCFHGSFLAFILDLHHLKPLFLFDTCLIPLPFSIFGRRHFLPRWHLCVIIVFDSEWF